MDKFTHRENLTLLGGALTMRVSPMLNAGRLLTEEHAGGHQTRPSTKDHER